MTGRRVFRDWAFRGVEVEIELDSPNQLKTSATWANQDSLPRKMEDEDDGHYPQMNMKKETKHHDTKN